MASTISAGTTTTTSLVYTADTSGVLQLQTNGTTTAVTIDTAQNVGVGVTPSAWGSGYTNLQLNGGSVSSQSTSLLRLFQNAYTNSSYNTVFTNNGYASLYTLSSGGHAWFTNSTNNSSGAGAACTFTQAMTLDNSGYLNVGTTGNTFHTLQVNGSNNVAVQIKNASATNGYCLDIVSASSAASGGTWSLIRGFASSSSQVFAVIGNGNVQNTNNSYGAISDVKLKENIVDATPKLADLLKVQVRNYNLKSDPTHKQLGVVAQELETVFPSMIEETPDKDAEGNNLGTTTKSVKYSVFVPMLIKAIQELSAKVTALEAKVG